MKSKVAMWLCLGCGILWVLVGFRDVFAPRFFTVRPGVMSRLDIAMEFAAAAVFLVAAASFYWAKPKVEGNEVSTTSP
jgi:Na+-driven multidrug efflux pump